VKKSGVDAAILVSLIYERLQNPFQYQGFTPQDNENLAGFDITDEELNTFSAGMLSPVVLKEITPHLEQALSLAEKLENVAVNFS